MPLYASVHMCLVVTCWERANYLGSCLWCFTVSLLLSHWYPWSGVALDCIDSWSLQPYLLRYFIWITAGWWFTWTIKVRKNGKDQESIQSSTIPDQGYQLESDNLLPRRFFKKVLGILQSSPSVCPSVTLSSLKPLEETQPNLVCELLTWMGRATAHFLASSPGALGRGKRSNINKYH